MKEQYKIIFDMDGTLYQFDKGKSSNFAESKFYKDIKNNAYTFLAEELGVSREEAISEFGRIKEKYDGGISLAVEKEYNIDRYKYFDNTWNLNPQEYIEEDIELSGILSDLKGRVALLTAAPRIWSINVLSFLDLTAIFENNIYTGEPDERKPDAVVFQRISQDFNTSPKKIISIGDQEHSDILPAKNLGMKTIFIGKTKSQEADYSTENIKLAIELLRQKGFI